MPESLDGDAVHGEFLDYPLQRVDGDQAQVGAAGRRSVGLRLELVTGPMQIDLAAAEGKRGAPRAERHRRHTQDAGVEVDGGVDVDYGQHQMVEPVDGREDSVVRRQRFEQAHPEAVILPPCAGRWRVVVPAGLIPGDGTRTTLGA
jgi:hypothetical protein